MTITIEHDKKHSVWKVWETRNVKDRSTEHVHLWRQILAYNEDMTFLCQMWPNAIVITGVGVDERRRNARDILEGQGLTPYVKG